MAWMLQQMTIVNSCCHKAQQIFQDYRSQNTDLLTSAKNTIAGSKQIVLCETLWDEPDHSTKALFLSTYESFEEAFSLTLSGRQSALTEEDAKASIMEFISRAVLCFRVATSSPG